MDATQQKLHAEMEEKHWWFVGRRHIMTTLVNRLIPPDSGRLIVDVGCGTGGNIASLVGQYATCGIDTSVDAIDLARTRFPSVRFWCGDLAKAPREFDEGADLYLMMDVLEHVPDDFLLLSTVLSRCSSGAQVLITVPAHEHLWSNHDEALQHYRRYDTSRLQSIWDGLPVNVRLVSYFNARLYPLIRVVRLLGRRLRRSYGQHGTDLSHPPPPVNRLLTWLFGGEVKVLIAAFEGNRSRGYKTGASLLAILDVESGPIAPRTKPPGVSPDRHIVHG